MGATAVGLAIEVLTLLPSVITAGEQVLSLIESTISSLKLFQSTGTDPTPEEWDAIHAQIAALQAQLQTPVGPVGA